MSPSAIPLGSPEQQEPGRRGSRPGDGSIRAGGVILVLGMLVSLLALLPLVSDVVLPSGFWWLSITLVGSGMGLILIGLLRKARSRSRAQRAATIG